MMHQKAGGLSSREGTRMKRYDIVVVVAHNVLSCCSVLLGLNNNLFSPMICTTHYRLHYYYFKLL